MKKKVKWNYAVMRTIFGDYWIGKTKLPCKKESIFADLEDAIQKVEMLFEDAHFDFDPDDESDENGELLCRYEDIRNNTEESIELIKKNIEKFII
jgi:hypothetical protein